MNFQKQADWFVELLVSGEEEETKQRYEEAVSFIEKYRNKESEKLEYIFENTQEYLFFTSKRLIHMDKNETGITHVLSSMPYSRILFYETEVVNAEEGCSILPALRLIFINGFTAAVYFQDYQEGNYQLPDLEKLISNGVMVV